MRIAYADPPYPGMSDYYVGTGAVRAAWESWRAAPMLPRLDFSGQGAKAESTIPFEGAE